MIARAIACCLAVFASTAAFADPALDRAKALLDRVILFDGHNDLPWAIHEYKAAPGNVAAYDLRVRAPADGQTDIPRVREGRLGAQFWSVYIPPEVGGSNFARMQLEQIDIAKRVIARYPDVFQLAGTAAEIRAAKKEGRIGSMLGAEGCTLPIFTLIPSAVRSPMRMFERRRTYWMIASSMRSPATLSVR